MIVGKENGEKAKVVPLPSKSVVVNSKQAIYDIGPASIKLFSSYIKRAKTLIWNGAMGKFEVAAYSHGTSAIADVFAARSNGPALGVAGGGETVEILRSRGIINQVDLVSTGGGAMLEYLSGKQLPGLEALKK